MRKAEAIWESTPKTASQRPTAPCATPRAMSGPGVAIALIALFGAIAVGCGSTPPPSPSPTPTPGEATRGDPGLPPRPNLPGTEVEDEPVLVPQLATIYFDYDIAEIRADARRTLRANAEAILARTDWPRIIVEGHTDDRGSDEYNLALGQRRSTAAMRYLADLGVPRDRFLIVSFGESSPAVSGPGEAAWQWNRRVEFRIPR